MASVDAHAEPRDVRVSEITLDGLVARLILNENGEFNLQQLGRDRAPTPQPTPANTSKTVELATPPGTATTWLKLGKATPKSKPYESFRPFFCYVEVEDELLTIVKQTGSQRPAGRLWPDDEPTRLSFLGSLALGDETVPLAYGDDPKRNMAGVFQRIGPFRWRLVIPWPQSTSKLDVFELTPVALQPQG